MSEDEKETEEVLNSLSDGQEFSAKTSDFPVAEQVMFRIGRVEAALKGVAERIDTMENTIVAALEGRTRVSERCIGMVERVLTSGNVKWFVILAGIVVVGMTGMSLTYGDLVVSSQQGASKGVAKDTGK